MALIAYNNLDFSALERRRDVLWTQRILLIEA